MGKGVVRLPLDTFRDLLQLPEEYKPLRAYVTLEEQFVCLLVEHPDLPEKKDTLTGCTPIPEISLAYTQWYVPAAKIVHLAEIYVAGVSLKFDFKKRGNTDK